MKETDDLIRAIGNLPESKVPDVLCEQVMAQVSDIPVPGRGHGKRQTLYWAIAAGVAVLMILSLVSLRTKFINPGKEDASVYFNAGVSYGQNGEYKKEESAYLKALELRPEYHQARYFLGHCYMNQQAWQKAANTYDMVLSASAGFERAGFNKGLALKKSGRINEAMTAWKAYLENQKTGVWAFRAVDHLNAGGDFTYRTFLMGRRNRIIGPFQLEATSSDVTVSDDAIEQLARPLQNVSDMDLLVMVFRASDRTAARQAARNIKNRFLDLYPDIRPERIKLSWFGEPDKVLAKSNKVFLEYSIRFLGIKREILKKGV